ncbi:MULTISPECIES: hypothetical protein [Actinosynnema]|uniref:Uncharacterized protein n=2 Tax=Actinosynnema TaxID=40566 RepID=C6WPS8_ACTMD|nr:MULTISPECIES: hypothetical protein [Actinosynnema]ACU40629.1 hypothetical protein Amir_6833 [Actinosynnema mirum DSM 43827]AXX34139.1 hypothetical protein APASM_6774 [Actinosynnema pretiosum subsp. pretiosum]MCP2093770.1 hypothetical protein [Actinosynnema pretiosum]QUF02134.1 hypothetical protein KCV87_21805 [Actinosynnema pretiosum subsp. pretiosum]
MSSLANPKRLRLGVPSRPASSSEEHSLANQTRHTAVSEERAERESDNEVGM